MELTNEIKQKLIYQYFGQKYLYKNEFGTYSGTIGEYHTNEHIGNNFFVLRLKSLSEITDEDAIEVAKILTSEPEHLSKESLIDIGENLVGSFNTQYTGDYFPCDIIEAYQFLISKGYDLPQYLLNGKTLKEVGLAIYK